MPTIVSEKRGAVRLLTMCRPERRNAMVPEMMEELTAALRSVSSDSVRAVVLTGSDGAFSVGADLKWASSQTDAGEALAQLAALHHETVRAIVRSPVPVVAAVNGPAAGGGMSLALAADYRIAAPNATFTAAYFKLGLSPDGGNSALLVRSLGVARAMELLLSNRSFLAQEAHAWGLLAEVVPAETNLVDRACAVVDGLAIPPPASLLATRRLLELGLPMPLDDLLDQERQAMAEATKRPEFLQALDAFINRSRAR